MVIAKSISRIVKETAPIITVYAVLELLAGGILTGMSNEMKTLPGLVILIPPLLDMRGNIGSAFGARMGSALHLGYIRPLRITKVLKTNIYSSLILSFFMSFLLGIIAWLACFLTGSFCITFTAFILISVIAGFSSGVVITFIAIGVSEISYRKGLDPDDITTPTISSLGDIVTILCLLLTVKFVLGVGLI